MSPQVIGNRYRLRSVLARRGPVSSFLAGDERLGRDVVLAVADPGGQGEHLTSVAEVVSTVAHPGFLPILEVGGEDAWRYVAFELPAETLTAAVAREALGAAEVRQLGIDLALALGVLHLHGAVHGALHPGAVGLDAGGRALLALTPLAPPPPGWGGDRAFTATEHLAGTAPTPAGDVFGFGAILLSSLVGDGPGSLEAPAVAALAERLRAAGEPVLLEVIGSSLARDPLERPGSLHEVASYLAGGPEGEGHVEVGGTSCGGATLPMATSPTARRRERDGFGRGVVALAVSALVVLVLVRVGDRPPSPSVTLHVAASACATAGGHRRQARCRPAGEPSRQVPAAPPALVHRATPAPTPQRPPRRRQGQARRRVRLASSSPRPSTERLVLTAARRPASPPLRRRPPPPPAGGRAPGPPSPRGVARVVRAEPHDRLDLEHRGWIGAVLSRPSARLVPPDQSGPPQGVGWPGRGRDRQVDPRGRLGDQHGWGEGDHR